MFGRRKRDEAQPESSGELEAVAEGEQNGASDEVAEISDDEGGEASLSLRPDGPWDASEVPGPEGRLDLGSIWVPATEGMELRLDVDQTTGQPVSITCVTEHGAFAAQAFAAPRSEGIWADVRREIRQQISSSGNTVDERDGEWGVEIATHVPAAMPDGSQGSQPARFVGIDGPRWFLRLVFLGPAAVDEQARAVLSDIARGLVVARDSEPRAPGDPLPLRIPESETEVVGEQIPADSDESAPWQDGDLDPFERGPEITEIR